MSLYLILLSFFKLPQKLYHINTLTLVYHITQTKAQLGPEFTVPILGICLLSFFHQLRSTEKFEAYPYFLWLGCFSLFATSFLYLSYLLLCFLILFINFNSQGGFSITALFKALKKYQKQFLVTVLMTVILFIIFPRLPNFIPSVIPKSIGEIGYNKDINNSQTSNLKLSSKVAFYVELEKAIAQDLLYWRGRVLTKTDGYNWYSHQNISGRSEKEFPKKIINQKFVYKQDFQGDIILLDRAIRVFDSNLGVQRIPQTGEFRSYLSNKRAKLSALSSLTPPTENIAKSAMSFYLQLPTRITPKLSELAKEFSSKNASEIIKKFKYHILSNKFSYSLTPGPLYAMSDFLEKKVGYCTHYASFLGMVLRLNNIPTRLINGFQGGVYNDITSHYVVKANDAHSWVEYYANNKWNRVDPTGFISPERINQGGDNFFNQNEISTIDNNQNNIFSKSYYQVTKIITALNYKVSALIDNYDRSTQKRISDYLNLKIETMIYTGFGICLILIGLYYYSQRIKIDKTKKHPADALLLKLNKKLKKDGIYLKPNSSIRHLKSQVAKHPSNELLFSFFNFYQEFRYGKINHTENLNKIIDQL